MLNPTKEEIQKKYNSLPPELKNTLFDKDISRKIFNICAQFETSEGETKKILKIIGFVFLGFLQENDLKKEILETLTIEKKRKDNLIEKLNSEVFLKYKKILFSPTAENKQSLLSSDTEEKQRLSQSNIGKGKNIEKVSGNTKISSGAISPLSIKYPLKEEGKNKDISPSQGSNSDSLRLDRPAASSKISAQSSGEDSSEESLPHPRDRIEAKITKPDAKNYQRDSLEENRDHISAKDIEIVEKQKESFGKEEADKYLEPIDEEEEKVRVLKIEGRIKKVL